MEKRNKVLFVLLLLFFSDSVFAATAESFLSQNVNAIDETYSYKDDKDDSRFRLKAYKAKAKQVAVAMYKNKSNLCDTARSRQKFDVSSSANYVVSVLKKAGAIKPEDKNYAFKSAHFFWEYYLTYRNFVDVSRSFRRIKSDKIFQKLPESYVLLVEKGCVANGAVALFCSGEKLYTTRFPNFEKLKQRIGDPSYKNCKVGKDVRIIVESKRLLGSI